MRRFGGKEVVVVCIGGEMVYVVDEGDWDEVIGYEVGGVVKCWEVVVEGWVIGLEMVVEELELEVGVRVWRIVGRGGLVVVRRVGCGWMLGGRC